MSNTIEDLRSRVSISDAYYKSGELDRAIGVLEPMVNEKVDYFRPYMNLGFMYWLKAEYVRAIPLLETALEKVPGFPDALFLLGKCLVVDRRFEQGLERLEAYRAKAPEDNTVLRWQARALWGLGRSEDAAAVIRDEAARMGWRTPFEKKLMLGEEPWFLAHIENWTKRFAPLRNRVRRALEIGCMEGMSSIWIAENLLARDGRLTINDITFRPNFKFNLEASGYADRIDLKLGDSGEVLPRLPEKTFDFIYVDGDHSARGVFRDCVNACVVAKPNATIVLDDYGKANEATKAGIDLFLKVFGHCFSKPDKQYQVFMTRTQAQAAISAEGRMQILAALSPDARVALFGLKDAAFMTALRSGAAEFGAFK